MPNRPPHDAIVLAGGRASRLDGTPKPAVVVAGAALIDHVLAATTGAAQVVVVGPEGTGGPGVRTVREEPAFGGPVAGVAAGLRSLGEGSGWVLVLACDVPRAALAVPALLDAVGSLGGPDPVGAATGGSADGAFLVRDGRAQWLVGLYRRAALDARVAELTDAHGGVDGLAVRALVGGLDCVEVPDDAGLSDDLDTWDDVARFGARAAATDGKA